MYRTVGSGWSDRKQIVGMDGINRIYAGTADGERQR
jgi:hypothetical protein